MYKWKYLRILFKHRHTTCTIAAFLSSFEGYPTALHRQDTFTRFAHFGHFSTYIWNSSWFLIFMDCLYFTGISIPTGLCFTVKQEDWMSRNPQIVCRAGSKNLSFSYFPSFSCSVVKTRKVSHSFLPSCRSHQTSIHLGENYFFFNQFFYAYPNSLLNERIYFDSRKCRPLIKNENRGKI